MKINVFSAIANRILAVVFEHDGIKISGNPEVFAVSTADLPKINDRHQRMRDVGQLKEAGQICDGMKT